MGTFGGVGRWRLLSTVCTMPKSKKVGTKRKRKDPNRPKNAPTAYILFCQAQRPKVVAEHPNADFAATNKMLGEMWRAQPPEVQNEVKKKSSLLKMEAQKAQAKYDKEHPPESDDDEGPRKRRKKKAPDAPKKPTSAYFFYQREVRQQVKDDAPEGTSVRDIAKLVAERWRKLTEDEKRPYKVSAEKDRVRYRVEKEEYESKRPPPVESSSSSSSEDSSSSESDVSSDSESD